MLSVLSSESKDRDDCFLPKYVAQQSHYCLPVGLSVPQIDLCAPSMYILHTSERPLGRSLRD